MMTLVLAVVGAAVAWLDFRMECIGLSIGSIDNRVSVELMLDVGRLLLTDVNVTWLRRVAGRISQVPADTAVGRIGGKDFYLRKFHTPVEGISRMIQPEG